MEGSSTAPTIGGFFLQSADPKFLARWMEDRLGLPFGTQLYASLFWKPDPSDASPARTELGLFRKDTDYFAPSSSDFMLDLRVKDLFRLLDDLRTKGVDVLDKTESFEYGHFGWILDPEGNKIELWEASDADFAEPASQTVATRFGVNGIGGIFIKSRNPKTLSDWYREILSMPMQGTMALFRSFSVETGKKQTQVFSFFPEDSDYFAPSDQCFMLNFRTDRLDELVQDLKEHGETLVGETSAYPQGRFAWVLDPEGRKIELWEPS
jgi:predicted enzyme related to lactoylglutathione lyase